MKRALDPSRIVGGSTSGLSDDEAAARRDRYGPNDIVEAVEGPWWAPMRATARDPMIWLLAGTGVVYAILGAWGEASTMFVSIAPLVGMDLFLHRRTLASTAGLSSRLASTARVVRDGVPRDIPARDLVPGDLMIVSTGQPFPADGIVVAGTDMQADESALTGEAFPSRKRAAPAAALSGEVSVDGEHWGFAGTRLLTGEARLLVAATGVETMYGEIVRSAESGTTAADAAAGGHLDPRHRARRRSGRRLPRAGRRAAPPGPRLA